MNDQPPRRVNHIKPSLFSLWPQSLEILRHYHKHPPSIFPDKMTGKHVLHVWILFYVGDWYHSLLILPRRPCFFQTVCEFRVCTGLSQLCFSYGDTETQTQLLDENLTVLAIQVGIGFWVWVTSFPLFSYVPDSTLLCLVEFLSYKQNSTWVSSQ